MFNKNSFPMAILKYIFILFLISMFLGLYAVKEDKIELNTDDILISTLGNSKIRDENSADLYNKMKKDYYESINLEQKSVSNKLSERMQIPITNDLHKAMALDYMNIVTSASLKYGTPRWYLIGYNTVKNGGLYTKNPPVPISRIPIELYGEKIESSNENSGNTKEIASIETFSVASSSNNSTPNLKGRKLPEHIEEGSLLDTIIKQQKIKRGELKVPNNQLQYKNPNKPEDLTKKVDVKIDNSIDTSFKNQKYKTFHNIGYKDVENYYIKEKKEKDLQGKYIGALQLTADESNTYGQDGNMDGKVDQYNLYDAIHTVAYKSLLDTKHNTDLYNGSDSIWIYNLLDQLDGSKLVWKKYIDSGSSILDLIIKEINSDYIYEKYLEGDKTSIDKEILEFWIKNGWKLNQSAVNKISSMGITLDNKDGNKRNTDVENTSGIPKLTYLTDDGKLEVNMEQAINASLTYSVGKSIEKELSARLNGTNSGNIKIMDLVNKSIDEYNSKNTVVRSVYDYSGGLQPKFNKVFYFWQNGTDKKDRRYEEGQYGEVGYKGVFPIFIQAPGFNNVSKVSWRFGGGSTTLGKAGCSIFTATSLVHAAGYRDYNIPGTSLKPTIQNMAKVFNNGPIIGNHMSSQGYKIQYRSTSTKKDLNVLYDDLKSGIPYAVNVRRGSITGYDLNGNPIKTEFTYGGHFMLLVSAFESDGKRWVEVVQSSRGNAGTKRIDQNQMLFDFDEIINKNILRSSQGNSVPAYTIVGGEGLPVPTYLRPDYKSPLTTTKSEIIEMQTQNLNSDSVILRRNKAIRNGESFQKIKKILDNLNIKETDIINDGKKLKGGIKINNIDDNLLAIYEENGNKTQNVLMFIDYNNAIQITNIYDTPNRSGLLRSNEQIGITTDKSKIYYVIRTNGDDWLIMKSNEITVTAE